MSRDPFEHMKQSNPVPPDLTPSAPMSMAERIIGARRGFPAWALTVVTAAAVLLVGVTSLWLFGGDAGDQVAGGETTTTSTADPTSTTAATTSTTGAVVVSTTVADLDFPTAVYFLVDPTGESWSGGPFLMPVARVVDEPDPVTGTIQALLDGPFPDESASIPMITTAIPDGTTLNGVSVDAGIATVDLSAEFAAGSGSFTEAARLEQLLYTVTRLDGIDGMRLEIEGEPVAVFGSHGIVLDDPVVRTDTDMTLPAILIESPAYGSFQTGNPLVATGTANVFEATVSVALADNDGLILWEGFATASCGTGCRGEWEVSIPYDVSENQMGSLIVWESSARDGSQTNVREHPVWLVTSRQTPDTSATSVVGGSCSGSLVDGSLVVQPGIPDPVRDVRRAIFEAATSCNWQALDRLIGDEFTYSFGGGTDPIGYWQELEDAGEQPMRYLAELLNRPYRQTSVGETEAGYAWPSAFGVPWDSTGVTVSGAEFATDADKEALRPLYDDEDFAGFDAFGGYVGYRIGIDADGAWIYFVAGD